MEIEMEMEMEIFDKRHSHPGIIIVLYNRKNIYLEQTKS